MSKRITRRRMLCNSAIAGFGIYAIAGRARGEDGSPNEKLNIAVIAAGGRGAANLAGVSGENIVALCDADERRAAATFNRYPNTPKYHDYRKLLDEMEKQIDAVVVSTPNHVHAPASVTAMRMGKHAYCEKPLSHSVHEARVAAQVAAEKKVATQMGTQIHATENFRQIVELIGAGAIGPVRECHIWLRGGGSAGDRPKETPPVPEGLHWDVWLGPAPWRPYHPCYVPHDWHYWWDFGGGAFGNMGCHYFDLAFWALDLRHPQTIEATGPRPHRESTPDWCHIEYRFAARSGRPPVLLTWNHGRKEPEFWARKGLPNWAWGVFVGDEGMLAVSYPKHQLLPADKFADYRRPEPTIPRSIGHHAEWVRACKTGSPTTCNFDYSGAVTETVLLGNIAYRAGEKLQWDPVNMRFPNYPEAEKLLRRDYRPGWTL